VLTGAGVQLSFILVASFVLALFLIGWRAIFRLIQHARSGGEAARDAQPEKHSTSRI
jgi:hypothetical protein